MLSLYGGVADVVSANIGIALKKFNKLSGVYIARQSYSLRL